MVPGKLCVGVSIPLLFGILWAPLAHADGRKIDPTFLYRNTSSVATKPSDVSTATCHYKPLFG